MNFQLIKIEDHVLIKPILIFLVSGWPVVSWESSILPWTSSPSSLPIILHYTVPSCCCLSCDLSPSYSIRFPFSHSTLCCILSFWVSSIGLFCTISSSFDLSFIIPSSSHSTLSFIISLRHIPPVYSVLFLIHEIPPALSLFHYILLSPVSVLFHTTVFLVVAVDNRFTADRCTALR